MASIKGWKDTLRTNIYHPKPEARNAEHDRLWEAWFCEQFTSIGNTLNVFAQLTRQWTDNEGKSGVFQLGRKELKDIIQAEINRLQSLVDEL